MTVKRKKTNIHSFGMGKELFRIFISAVMIALLQYVYVHIIVLGEQSVVYDGINRSTGIYQLYFGGLFFENSMDSFALLCVLGIFIVQTMFLSGVIIGEWFQNLEVMLYRTEKRQKLLYRLLSKIAVNLTLLIILNTGIVCAVEGILPVKQMMIGSVLYFLQIFLFTLCIILFYFWIKSEISYVIAGVVYLLPMVFVGFIYNRNQTVGEWVKSIVTLRGNWNYYSSIKILLEDGTQLVEFNGFSQVSLVENMVLMLGACLIIYIVCVRLLKRYEVR